MINIARNKAIDSVRSKETTNKNKTIELTDNVYTSDVATSKIEDIGLKRVLNELPKETRKLMELAYFQGYTQDEISKILSIPIGTVKTRIRTTLIQLRKILGVNK
jgi:RNA polymerase sigma-70 factor (ECF subfamily)